MMSDDEQIHGWSTEVGVEAFADYAVEMRDANFLVPALPNVDRNELTIHSNGWLFTSDIRLHSMAPYMLEPFGGIPFGDIKEDFIVFGHNGHGINSFAVGLIGRIGNLIIAQQEPYGGVYMDNEARLRVVNAQTELWNELVEEGADSLRHSSTTYMVLFSSMRNLAMILVQDRHEVASSYQPLNGWRVLCDPLHSEQNRNILVHRIGFDDPTYRRAGEYLMSLLSLSEEGREILSGSYGHWRREEHQDVNSPDGVSRYLPDPTSHAVRFASGSTNTDNELGIDHFYLISGFDRQYVLVQGKHDAEFDDTLEKVSELLVGWNAQDGPERARRFDNAFREASRFDFEMCSLDFDRMYEEGDIYEDFLIEHDVEMMLRQLNGAVSLSSDFEKYQSIALDPIHVDMSAVRNGAQWVLSANFKKRYQPFETGEILISFERHHSLMVFPEDGLFASYDMETYEHLMAGGKARRLVTTHIALPMIQWLHEMSHEMPSEDSEIWHVGHQESHRHGVVELGGMDHECLFAPMSGDADELAFMDCDSEIEVHHFENSTGRGFVSEISFFGARGRYRFVNGRWKLQTPFEDSLLDGAFGYVVPRQHVSKFLKWVRDANPTLEEMSHFERRREDGFIELDLSTLSIETSVDETAHAEIDLPIVAKSVTETVKVALYEFDVQRDPSAMPVVEGLERFYVFSDDRDQIVLYSPESNVELIKSILYAMEYEGEPRNDAEEWCQWLAGFAESYDFRPLIVREVLRTPDALQAFIFRVLHSSPYKVLNYYSNVYPEIAISNIAQS